MNTPFIREKQWQQYEQEGYLNLGKVLSPVDLDALARRINDIMEGRADVDYDSMLMQQDSEDGQYENAGKMSRGFKGASLNYRKIEQLEFDALYREYMERLIFREICSKVHGAQTPISCFRAMFMNKPAQRGTLLPWHQDRWRTLDKDPLITIWTALDPATKANGCVQVIPGSHKFGLINPSHGSGFLTQEQAEEHAPPGSEVYLELEAGEVALLHNWLLHRSDTNSTDASRRAFSVCYMDGRTVNELGNSYPLIFEGEAI